MALLKCPDCGGDVSDMADACPKCGYPVSKIKASAGAGDNSASSDEVKGAAISSETSESKPQIPATSAEDKTQPPSSSMESAAKTPDNKQKKIAAIVAGVILIVIALIAISQLGNCSSPSIKVSSITPAYFSDTSEKLSATSYADLAGTVPEDLNFSVAVAFDNNTSAHVTTADDSSEDKGKLSVEVIDGPVPLEDGKETTYQLSYTYGDETETCEVKILGIVASKIQSVSYTGSTVEGTTPSASDFTLTIAYSNGLVKDGFTPTNVSGGSLVKGKAVKFTISYQDLSTTYKITGTAAPAKVEATDDEDEEEDYDDDDDYYYDDEDDDAGSDYKKSCKSVTYKDLVQKETKWQFKSVKFKGRVATPLGTSYATAAYIVYMTKNSDGTWTDPVYMDITMDHMSVGLTEGDICMFYGDYDGLVSASELGIKGKVIPSLAVDYVDILS